MADILRLVATYLPQWLKAIFKKIAILVVIGIPLIMFLEDNPQYAPIMKIVGVVIYSVLFVIIATGMGVSLYAAVKNRSIMQFLYSLVLGAICVGYILYRVNRSFPELWQTVSAWFQ